ncbi:MAG TPA: alpha/beta hydrolase-fold protein [Flavisolibacter sp.]|nr:alpha/beta hydrolase-fold protein [Flavisolibacter sp.]
MKKIFCLITILVSAQAMFGQEVTIPGTEVKQITSVIVPGQEYQLHIMLPGGYTNSNKSYPVVYLMDSQWDFPLVSALYGEQYYDGFIPQMIIVGVTWGGMKPNPDSLRARDYTPTNVKGTPQSGGADKFLSFMKDELFSFIEKNYRADKTDRTLVGCSLGGLFTMYALFTHPEMFQRYVAASPAFMWDNSVLYQFEKKYAANKSNPSAKLFMCVGWVERSVPGFQKLTEYLNDRHYNQLQIESRVLKNTGHSGTKGEGYARGLQFVFKRPSLQLSNTALDKYTGKYRLPDGTTTEIKKENNQLFLYFSPNEKIPLFISNEKELYSTSQYMNIKFNFDEHQNISSANVEMFGGSITATKL